MRRAVEDRELAQIVQCLEKDKAKQAKLEEIASRKLAEEMSCSSKSSDISGSMQEDSSSSDSMDRSKMDFQTSDIQSVPGPHDHHEQMEVEQIVRSHLGGATGGGGGVARGGAGGRGAGAGPAGGAGGRGAAAGPAGGAGGRQRKGQSEIEQLRNLNIPGVEIITPDDFNDLTPEQQQVGFIYSYKFEIWTFQLYCVGKKM